MRILSRASFTYRKMDFLLLNLRMKMSNIGQDQAFTP